MGLAPGSHLGPYEIVAPLGAGGMGENTSGDLEIWTFDDFVEIRAPASFGAPVARFSNARLGGWPAPAPYGHDYDVSPDGQRIVLALIKKPSGQSPISVVVNWQEELN